MARPIKPTTDRRSEIIRFRCKPSELAKALENAAKAGKSPSEYARSLVCEGRVVVRQHRTIDPHTFDQLRRIGVNLNQLVRLFHAKGTPPPELFRAVATVERFLSENIEDGP